MTEHAREAIPEWIESNSDKFSGIITPIQLEDKLLDIGFASKSIDAIRDLLPEQVDNIMREDLARAEFERDSIEQIQVDRVESAVRELEQLPQKEDYVTKTANALRSIGNSIKSIFGKAFRR